MVESPRSLKQQVGDFFLVVGSCQHNPEWRGPFLNDHLEGHKAAESLKDCKARVIPFTNTEDACSASFSCSSPLCTTSCTHRFLCSCRPWLRHVSYSFPQGQLSWMDNVAARTPGGTWEELLTGKIEGKSVLSQIVCSVRLQASWDAGSTCRLRKRRSVSPRRLSLVSEELSWVRHKCDSRDNHVAREDFLFWVMCVRTRPTCVMSKTSSACELPSVTTVRGQAQAAEVCAGWVITHFGTIMSRCMLLGTLGWSFPHPWP